MRPASLSRALPLVLFSLAIASTATLTTQLSAQAPAFEVASIKPNRSVSPEIIFSVLPDGRFRAVNATTREIIRSAYGFDYQMFQIVDAPSWVDSERFDIDARPEGTATGEQVSAMMRTLLADRFKLALRQEKREMPVYALVTAREDGRLGAQLRRSAATCEATRLGPNDVPLPPTPEAPRCGLRVGAGANGTRITVVGRTMSQIATGLQGMVERIVTNGTTLEGGFDGELDFAREQRRFGPPVDPALLQAPASAVSIYTAVQEQWGLKLDSRRAPVDVLVVERIERPSEN